MTEYQYKLVDGELVPLTPDDIAELEERQKTPPPPVPESPPSHAAVLANQRIDAGIEAARSELDAADELARRPKPRTAVDQVAALQEQVDALQAAVEAMITAQQGPSPRS